MTSDNHASLFITSLIAW